MNKIIILKTKSNLMDQNENNPNIGKKCNFNLKKKKKTLNSNHNLHRKKSECKKRII